MSMTERDTSRERAYNTEYMRAYRDANRAKTKAARARQSARDRAMRQLARVYPGEFDKLYLAQLRALTEEGTNG